MNTIKFRIAAKTDVGLVRTNNEDNFQASSDLSCGQMKWVNNEICSLGDKGALIVVADGMGGMNAGEIASELAIETIREYFSPEKLTSDVLKTRFSVEKYMNDAIIAADSRIKSEAKVRPEAKGMGTTIVIGWILGTKLYVSWCGDSRAYVYNPSAGLHQISKDHSYVQGLVDNGTITRDESFDFPDSNIITRCLSDGSAKAKPESLLKPYEVCDNDIIMLCTDGLSGMIRDNETESIIRANEHNMDTLVDELINAACEAEGSDNITICLCQILQGGNKCNPAVFIDYEKRLNGNRDKFVHTIINNQEGIIPSKRKFWYIGIIGVIVAVIGGLIWWFGLNDCPKQIIQEETTNTIVEEPSTETKKEETQENKSLPTQDNHKDNGLIEQSNENNVTNVGGTIFPKNKESNHEDDSGAAQTKDEDDLTPISEDNRDNDNVVDKLDDTAQFTAKKHVVHKK